MQYMLIVNETETDFAQREANPAAYWGPHAAFGASLAAAGVKVGGGPLQPPSSGTVVRLRDGRRQVQDGPFADTKEQLGGYCVIDVPNLDVALEWAARCPTAATGSVEVRPLLSMS